MDCQSVIQKCIHVLQKLSSILSPTKKIPKILPRSEFYIPVLTKNQSTSLWQKTLVIPNFLINPDYHVAVFNPLECARTELIQLNVSYHLMKVRNYMTTNTAVNRVNCNFTLLHRHVHLNSRFLI